MCDSCLAVKLLQYFTTQICNNFFYIVIFFSEDNYLFISGIDREKFALLSHKQHTLSSNCTKYIVNHKDNIKFYLLISKFL